MPFLRGEIGAKIGQYTRKTCIEQRKKDKLPVLGEETRKVMTGARVKEKINEAGYSTSEIARRLGYERPQRLFAELQYDNIKSGLIEDIAEVMGKKVSWFYGEEESPAAASETPAVKGIKNRGRALSDDDLEWHATVSETLQLLAKETELLKRMIVNKS